MLIINFESPIKTNLYMYFTYKDTYAHTCLNLWVKTQHVLSFPGKAIDGGESGCLPFTLKKAERTLSLPTEPSLQVPNSLVLERVRGGKEANFLNSYIFFRVSSTGPLSLTFKRERNERN